jgi:hypothetical protein
MSALSVQPTFPIFTDVDGQPLEDGYIWIGTVNLPAQTNPISVYWDAGLTIPAAQPIRTLGGYPANNGTPARLYVNSDYSILVQNKLGSLVYSAPAATERLSDVVLTGLNAADVQYDPAGTGAVTTTVQAKLRETVSVRDFGAVGDGVTDDTAAIQAAIDYCAVAGGCVYIPAATYYCSSGLDLKALVSIKGDGYEASILQFDHTGYGIKFESAAVNTNELWGGVLYGFSVRNSNVSNTDGGIVLAGSSQGTIDNVRIGRFKYALILDQANIQNVQNCYFLSALTANVWLTNGPDYRAGASTGFTNRISIENCQFNGPTTMPWNIIDDGGQNHIISGNNINAGAKSVRFSSVA